VLDRLLAEVRAGSEEHRRAWGYRCDPDTPPPWSDADEAALGAFDLRSLGSAEAELDRVRDQLREVGAELGRLTREAVGAAAATVCARLAASTHGRADAAETLVGELRGAGGRTDELLEGAARRVLRALDADDRRPPDGPPDPWAAPPGRAPAPPSDDPPSRHLTLLRTLRAELGEALGSLPELLDRPDRPAPPAGWIPEPGAGPRLPGIEGRRIEPGYGVRVVRLPEDYRAPG
jgi:hypothetical protein